MGRHFCIFEQESLLFQHGAGIVAYAHDIPFTLYCTLAIKKIRICYMP